MFLLTVAACFFLLSADEATSIHEKITRELKHVEWMPRFKGDHGIWITVYTLIGVILFLANLRALAAMWTRYKRPCLIIATGMAILVLGAVGLEVVGYQFLRNGSTPVLYSIEVGVEEFFEMFGASVTLYGALSMSLNRSVAS